MRHGSGEASAHLPDGQAALEEAQRARRVLEGHRLAHVRRGQAQVREPPLVPARQFIGGDRHARGWFMKLGLRHPYTLSVRITYIKVAVSEASWASVVAPYEEVRPRKYFFARIDWVVEDGRSETFGVAL